MINLFFQWKNVPIYRNKSVKLLLLLSLKNTIKVIFVEGYLEVANLQVLSFPTFFHKCHVWVQSSVVPQPVSVKQFVGLEVPSSRVRFTWRPLHSHISMWSSGRSTETRMMGGCRMIFNCLRLSWTWENHASKLNQYTVHFLSWGLF